MAGAAAHHDVGGGPELGAASGVRPPPTVSEAVRGPYQEPPRVTRTNAVNTTVAPAVVGSRNGADAVVLTVLSLWAMALPQVG